MEGLTNEEAAGRLGCPKGTVFSRLSRARERLRQRLTRRGIDLFPSVLLAAMTKPASPALVEAAGRTGQLIWVGEAADFSKPIMSLAKKVMLGMFIRKLQVAGIVLFLTGLVAVGANWLRPLAAASEAGFVAQSAKAGTPRLVPKRKTVAAAEEAATPSHLTYRATTDLQREFFWAGINVSTLLDMTEAVKDGKVSPEGLKLDDLRKDLRKLMKAGDKIQFTLFFKQKPWRKGDSRARDLLRYAMIGVGHDVGFTKVLAYEIWTPFDITWGDYIKGLKKGAPGAEAPEPAVANKFVKVYPVLTEFSHVLTGGADCAVVVLTPLDKAIIPKEIREATEQLLGKLKLARKRRVYFSLPVIKGGIDGGQQLPKLLADEFFSFAKALGFEDSVVGTR